MQVIRKVSNAEVQVVANGYVVRLERSTSADQAIYVAKTLEDVIALLNELFTPVPVQN